MAKSSSPEGEGTPWRWLTISSTQGLPSTSTYLEITWYIPPRPTSSLDSWDRLSRARAEVQLTHRAERSQME